MCAASGVIMVTVSFARWASTAYQAMCGSSCAADTCTMPMACVLTLHCIFTRQSKRSCLLRPPSCAGHTSGIAMVGTKRSPLGTGSIRPPPSAGPIFSPTEGVTPSACRRPSFAPTVSGVAMYCACKRSCDACGKPSSTPLATRRMSRL